MHSRKDDKSECPVGKNDCPRLDELAQVRAQVDKLSKLVHTDALTGLFNYRHFTQALERELERTRRTGQPTSLVMVDLDHFKRINDEWGHENGNRVLTHCAALMKRMLRRIDLACRYGGEEFALILPATSLPRAVGAANRLRESIEKTPVQIPGNWLAVTASMGADVCMKGDDINAEALQKRADEFLYEAKRQGRNRVCHRAFRKLRPKGQVGREEIRELIKP